MMCDSNFNEIHSNKNIVIGKNMKNMKIKYI